MGLNGPAALFFFFVFYSTSKSRKNILNALKFDKF
jgi:hypothetical protein